VADGDGTVWLVDVVAGKTIRTVSEGRAGTPVLALRPDGQRLAIGDASGAVVIVTPGSWQEAQRLEVGGAVTALVWRGDGQRLAASVEGATNGGARVVVFGPPVPPTQPQPGQELVEHDALTVGADVIRLAFDRDGRDVWACHADGMLARWTAASPAALFKLDHGGPVLTVAVSRDGETIVSGGSDLSVRVWDGRTGQQRAQMTGHTAAVHALAFTPDDAFVVSAGADRTIRLWDVGGGRQLKQVATTEATQYAVAVQPDGRRVAAGGADRLVRLFDLATGAVERTLEGHGDFIHGVAFSPTGTSLLSYGYAGSLRIWNPADGVARFETSVGRIGNSASFAPDGDRVVVANGDATASIVGLPDGVR
jgi:WD40 repeat protein